MLTFTILCEMKKKIVLNAKPVIGVKALSIFILKSFNNIFII